jgi:CelD/BcsL family acetyltransferase involved in cellulose biosynthesis
MDGRMQGFFLDMARCLQSRGWLQLCFLEIEGARAATILNFVYQNDVLVYNSGYDPVKYGPYSPGIVLFAFSLQDAIAAKRRRFDFLRGDEEYKYRFGAHNTNVYELHLASL